MEHEVFVPVPAERLREALADPVRIARAVPGLQQDAGAEPVTGRLKVRVGSHSITYRGSVRVCGQDDGSYAVEGDATEARGTGSVKLALTLRLRDTDGGSTFTFEGTVSADGRVTELPPDAVASAATRLLSRFAENLGTAAADDSPERQEQQEQQGTTKEPQTPEPASVLDAEAPPPSLAEDLPEDLPQDLPEDLPEDIPQDLPEDLSKEVPEDFAEQPPEPPPEPPAEAAHARRTMIGRSAEEVDHAPPRGRYAPVPAPQTVAPNQTLRWAAPAAALVLASAVVLGRAWRRRR